MGPVGVLVWYRTLTFLLPKPETAHSSVIHVLNERSFNEGSEGQETTSATIAVLTRAWTHKRAAKGGSKQA